MTDTSALPLIGPQDPPPCQIVNDTGAAHVLLVCDHAGQAVPRALHGLGLSESDLARHIAWDIGAGAVTRHLARMLDAPAVMTNYSRLVVDPNRFLKDHAVAFPPVSDGTVIPGNQELTEADRSARARSFFWPYHNAISGHVDAMRERGILPAFVSVHSCTPEFQGHFRPWHVGVLWNQDPRISLPLIEYLRGMAGIEVGDNEPYSGRLPDFFTLAYHAEASDLPHVALEIRQDLIADAAGIRRWAEVLAEAFTAVLAPGAVRASRQGERAGRDHCDG
jgi:predicted N-formylglutamate amidohydrolase